jgi:hypothetical protein
MDQFQYIHSNKKHYQVEYRNSIYSLKKINPSGSVYYQCRHYNCSSSLTIKNGRIINNYESNRHNYFDCTLTDQELLMLIGHAGFKSKLIHF